MLIKLIKPHFLKSIPYAMLLQKTVLNSLVMPIWKTIKCFSNMPSSGQTSNNRINVWELNNLLQNAAAARKVCCSMTQLLRSNHWTTILWSKALKYLLAHSPSGWHTHTIHVSRLKNPLTCLLPFIYTSGHQPFLSRSLFESSVDTD
jgi:hypothetical protein